MIHLQLIVRQRGIKIIWKSLWYNTNSLMKSCINYLLFSYSLFSLLQLCCGYHVCNGASHYYGSIVPHVVDTPCSQENTSGNSTSQVPL